MTMLDTEVLDAPEMTTTLPAVVRSDSPAASARTVDAQRGLGDRVFFRGVSASGMLVLIIMGAVGVFLAIEAWPGSKLPPHHAAELDGDTSIGC